MSLLGIHLLKYAGLADSSIALWLFHLDFDNKKKSTSFCLDIYIDALMHSIKQLKIQGK